MIQKSPESPAYDEHIGVPLVLDHVSVSFSTPSGPARAVNDVSFTLNQGEILGLVGESGSGKSTLAFTIMGLLPDGAQFDSGSVRVLGSDLYGMNPETLRTFRWKRIAMVFQSAMNALNPVMTVEAHIMDTLQSHNPGIRPEDARRRMNEILDLVKIDPRRARSFPHELSGGMKQRIVLAIAMIFNPPVLLMDEPTTALDVVVQRSILDQVREIQAERQMAILFISHDFSLVRSLAHRVAIMYAGRIVEITGSLERSGPHHPYTEGLMRAIPELGEDDVKIVGIPGNPPDLLHLPEGCPFHPRCPVAFNRCKVEAPPMVQVNDALIACHQYTEPGKEGLA